MARSHGVEPTILAAVEEVNHRQKRLIYDRLKRFFAAQMRFRKVAIWGLAFKPRTDDIREAPALALIDSLLADGAAARVHDPEAMANVRAQYGEKLTYCEDMYDALDGVDALAVCTEWKHFVQPDFDEMKRRMAAPVIFDGRNIYDPKSVTGQGFTYFGIGRKQTGPVG
jgi:UDPglucose 6-dehydrogenase